MPARSLPADEIASVTEDEIDDVIRECGGAREAVRALLHDMTLLMLDAEQAVSKGYLHGRFADGPGLREMDDEL